ncbi:U4/U6-U5 snRNP complex subunit prp31 [Pseudogymnoascus australis]
MSTLADELLNDFEDSGSEGEPETENGGLFPEADGHAPTTNGNGESMELDGDEEDVSEDEDMTGAGNAIDALDDEEATKAKVEKMQLGGVDDVRSVAGLMKTLEPVLEKISYFQNLPPDQQTTHVGSIEDNPEYHLLTQSNTLSTSIDNEIILVHKFIRDHYSTRFPELETMVQNPLDYAKVVAIIGNGPMDGENIKRLQTSTDNILGMTLRAVLDGPSLMIVTVEATTTKGRALTPAELSRVLRACEMTLSLDRAKRTLTDYVQSRMTLFAPNLTALIGSLTAAQLLNFAGGLTGLAKTPACNLASLGSKKTAGTGFATNVGARQQGFLYHSPIIAGVPPDLRRQAQRIVAAKLVLAARVDRVHSSPSGATGEELKAACLERLEKLTIPPPNKGARALPTPDDKPSRKRGGRRARKAKEATAMTDLRKAQNRMVFGKEEVEGEIDPRTRAKLGKKNPGWGAATPAPGSGTASSLRGFGGGVGAMDLRGKGLRGSGVGAAGTASSVVFTPVQGLELVDPKIRNEVARKRKAEEEGWFKGGTFTQVGGGNGGFKVPDAKRAKSGMGPPDVPGGV